MINIEQKFDILGKYKYPKLKLCTPNRKGQGYLTNIIGLKIKKNFNALDELSFEINWILDGKENFLYEKVLGGKLIYADGYGYFIITEANVVGDGITEKKSVQAVSAEFEIAKIKLNRVEDTIKLFNPTSPLDDSTLLGMFVKSNPKWKIGSVDNALWNIYRTFDVQTSDWYNFLISDAEEKYMCIFTFDNVNRLINCYTPESATKPTSVFASFNNLIDNISIEEKFSEVFTALNCTGANYLDIRGVNPTGGNLIYNFKWYKNKDWISEALINKITLWEAKIALNQVAYREILTDIRETQVKLTTATTELVELESQLKADEQALAMLISSNDYDTSRYSLLVNKKNESINKISAKKNEINNIETALEIIKEKSTAITNELSFENNFTEDEISDLQDIIIVDNYQNNSFAKTDIMTQYEIQDLSQGLYDTAVKILDRVCEPRYYFQASLINFIFLKEYEKFTKQVDVGSIITVEIKKGWRTKVVLLSMELDFDNPTDFNMEFSNRYRLDNGAFEFSDLFVDNSKGNTSYDWDKMIVGNPVKSGTMHEITDFMNGNFEAAKNALESAKGVGVSLDGSGLHLRMYDETGRLLPFESWLTGGTWGISNDNFNTPPKVAIGLFKLPNSETIFGGVNAEVLAGSLIVGNQFVMESENGSFKFDGSGAKLYNAIFEVVDKSNIRRILLDPDNGFKIQGRINPNKPWEDKIYLDNDGNAVFIGKMTADSGFIGGLRIGKDGIFNDNNGDYWKTDGTGKFGLMTYTLNSATFLGDIYARNLKAGRDYGWIDNDKIEDNSISGYKLEASYRDNITDSIARVEIKADNNSSSITSLTSYTNTQLGYVRQNIASVEQKADINGASISLVVTGTGYGAKVNTASIVASVNSSGSSIMIDADKITLSGATTFISNVVKGINSGYTTINGGKITTDSITANQIKSGTITASEISSSYVYAGYIRADRISAGTINGVNFQWGNSSNQLYMYGQYGYWNSSGGIYLDARTSIGINAGSDLGIAARQIGINASSQLNLGSSLIRIGDNSATVYIRGSKVVKDTINYKLTNGNNSSMQVYRWI